MHNVWGRGLPQLSEVETSTRVSCLLCGGATEPWLAVPLDWRRPSADDGYTVVWCPACGFGSLAPRPQPSDIASFYDVAEYYTHQPEYKQNGEDNHLVNRVRVRLAWQFEHGVELDKAWFRRRYGATARRFCDIGCGAGGLLEIIRSAGHEAIGVDPDPEARRWANEHGLTVLEGTAEELPAALRNERFDAVFMTHTLEHCLDPVKAVRNALSLAREDGVAVIETPNNAAAAYHLYGPCWLHLDVPRHLNFFTEQSLRKVCAQAGGEVVEVEFRGYTRQFLGDIIRQQQRIWKCFIESGKARSINGKALMEPAPRRAWQLLLHTAFAEENRKYDSVRVIVRRSQ